MDSNYELSADKQPAVGKEKTSDSGEQERNNESVQKYLLVAGFCEKPDHSDNELFKIGTAEYTCNTYYVGELKFALVASTNKAIIIILLVCLNSILATCNLKNSWVDPCLEINGLFKSIFYSNSISVL